MKQLKITQNDPYLAPFESAIAGRHDYAIAREKNSWVTQTNLSLILLRDTYFLVCLK